MAGHLRGLATRRTLKGETRTEREEYHNQQTRGSSDSIRKTPTETSAKSNQSKWLTSPLQLLLTRKHLPNLSRGLYAPLRARRLNQARRDSETTSPAWRVLALTSQ